MPRRNYIISLLLLISCCCAGQELSFKHLTAADGLLSDLRLTMTEDRMGRLWIGSDEGINVFDGYELASYSQPDKSGLASNNIQRIFCDNQGTIWIRSIAGVQYKKEAETRFITLASPEKDLENTSWFGQTSKGQLLCVTDKEIYQLDEKLQATKMAGFTELMKKYGGTLTFDHFKDDQWFIGFTKKLVLVDIATQKVVNEYNYRAAWTVCRVNDSTALVGSFARDSVAILHLGSGLLEGINNWATSDRLPITGYTGTIESIGHNKYVLGCRLYGIYILDLEKKYAQHYTHDPGDPNSLKSRFTRRVFVTSEGTMFVHARGLSYTQIDTPQISTVRYIIDEKGQKYDGGFTGFTEDKKGTMWISTNIGLAKWDRKNGASKIFPYYDPKEGPIKFKTIRAVATDKLDRVWVCTFGGGLGLLRPDGTYEQFRRDTANPEHSLLSLEIQAIAKDHDENFILCTNVGPVYFEPIEKRATTFINHPKLKSIAKAVTLNALVDAKNNWWIAQQNNGLYYYDKIADSLHDIMMPGFTKDNIGFYAIAQDAEGNTYIGSSRGLYLIKKGTFSPELFLSKKDGLPTDYIVGLFFDKAGALWILGNRGLAKYDIQKKILQSFGAKDGAENSNHSLMNYYLAADGEIYIGTNTSGFNHFYPDRLNNNKKPLKIFITSVSLPDSVINISQDFDFTFEHDQNNLSFSFITVDYTVAPFVQYRYKLIGFDTAFIYAGKQRLARYTNLAAGYYTFTVEASSDGRDWYAAPHNLHIKIKVAFWNSWWFRLVGAIIIVGIFVIAYRTRIEKINHDAQLKANYEIKLNELEISALRTQMNPHFIFNSLNTINSFINSNDRAQANQYISKFSRLIRLILDHSRNKKISLADEMSVVELYMQMEQIRFEHKFSFEIKTDPALDADTVEIPPLIIQPFVENSILHGLLPSDIDGLLKVTVTKEENKIICTIEDNGIGRENAKLNKKQDPVKRESHGMGITLKRIDLFNKENGVQDKVEIIDLQDPTGTKVIIPLALVESY